MYPRTDGLPTDYNNDEYLDCDDYLDDDDDEEEYYYDVDQNTHSHREQINTFPGHSAQSPLTPHPRIKQLTSEVIKNINSEFILMEMCWTDTLLTCTVFQEAEKHAKALLEDEKRLKEKTEKKRQKKLVRINIISEGHQGFFLWV